MEADCPKAGIWNDIGKGLLPLLEASADVEDLVPKVADEKSKRGAGFDWAEEVNSGAAVGPEIVRPNCCSGCRKGAWDGLGAASSFADAPANSGSALGSAFGLGGGFSLAAAWLGASAPAGAGTKGAETGLLGSPASPTSCALLAGVCADAEVLSSESSCD